MTATEDVAERARTALLLGGAWRRATGGVLSVENPGTGTVVFQVAAASQEDAVVAVAAARQTHREGTLRRLPSLARGRILHAVADLLRRHGDEVAEVVHQETGMPRTVARYVELPMAADVFDYYAGLASRPLGEVLPFDLPGAPPEFLVLTLRQPIGPAAVITPWNFPLLMPAWKLGAALAAGAPVLLKPAPETPLTAVLLGALLYEAGLPEGALSVLPGGDDLGRFLVRHPDLPRVALTGGLATGRRVLKEVTEPTKRLSLELGGKSPLLVFADVDLDAAVATALFGVFFQAGQVCQASSRVLVQREVYEPFVERLVARASALSVGYEGEVEPDIGPVISKERLEAIAAMVEEAVRLGAKARCGGRPLPGPGYFFPPTVLTEVRPEMAVAQEEVFGPVVVVLPFADEAEAIRLANDTVYGLAAAVLTRDAGRALRVAAELEAGTVWLNAVQFLTPSAPFGGFKGSGLGRDLGEEGMRSFQEVKTLVVHVGETPIAYF